MKHFSHLNTATEIISTYNGRQPFHQFTRDFFRQYKKYGSKDRKQITHLCYCYFRLGGVAKNKPLQQAITEALFLCSDQYNELLAAVQPALNDNITRSVEEKCALLHIPFDAFKIFPFTQALSNGIDAPVFNLSHLKQPNVFLRIRPGQQQTVTDKLEKAGIVYAEPASGCISVSTATKVDELLQVNKEVVIQDYSSQRTGMLMKLITAPGPDFAAWDCCAASGGKSIMAKDIFGNINLTVSDVRPSVLLNLTKRFAEAGIANYTLLEADLTKPITTLHPAGFDLIIADVPCTGSGTWGRTPERLSFFDEEEIDTWCRLQKKILTTVIPHLKASGHFLYITCSVFRKENEEMADFIQKNFPVELVKMETLKGYDVKADTMFAAMFRNSTE